MELDLKEVNYLRELVELRPEKETMLDLSKDNTSRKRERARSQKSAARLSAMKNV